MRSKLSIFALATILASAVPASGQVLLVCRYDNNNVFQSVVGKYDAVTGAPVDVNFILGHGVLGPQGLIQDGNNHLFVSNNSGGNVTQYNLTTGAEINSNFIPNLVSPWKVLIDSHNHLFVGGTSGSGTLGEFDATTGAAINSNFLASNPFGMALDGNNHLFVTLGNTVGVYDATTGALINPAFVQFPQTARRLVLDSFDHLFVSGDFSTGVGGVAEFDATTGATINSNLITTEFTANGIALDGNNHLYLIHGGHTVSEYDATTGAIINASFITGPASMPMTDLIYVASVPEPGALTLLGLVAGGCVIHRRMRPPNGYRG